jgi:fused signal recognition particle receptor
MVDILDRWKKGLARSSKAAFGRIASVLGATEIGPDTWDELEAILIQADLGLETTQSIIAKLKVNIRTQGITKAADIKPILKQELKSRLPNPPLINLYSTPFVIMLVGVNGSGKTTTIAKLGQKYAASGKKVQLVAADTFRAAAVDQLQVWAERLNIPIITGKSGSDPGAVVYDAIQSAIARQIDILLIDTAGRLHTRYNLMEELKKVFRVAGKAMEGAPHATWLVLDATTGQNALLQARSFKEAVNVSGIILAKLDSSAKGGMAFAIQEELGLPILFAGLGESPDDLQPFDPDEFIKSILNF